MRRALMVLLGIMPGIAFAGPHRDAVLELLNAYEESATRAELEKLGEGVALELMEIADDDAVPSSRRGRAVSALAFYATEDVRGFLEDHLKKKGEKSLIRRKAAFALAASWPVEAIPHLAKALADDDVQVRVAVANALGGVGSDAAKDALRARLVDETETAVREAIEKSLAGGQ